MIERHNVKQTACGELTQVKSYPR